MSLTPYPIQPHLELTKISNPREQQIVNQAASAGLSKAPNEPSTVWWAAPGERGSSRCCAIPRNAPSSVPTEANLAPFQRPHGASPQSQGTGAIHHARYLTQANQAEVKATSHPKPLHSKPCKSPCRRSYTQTHYPPAQAHGRPYGQLEAMDQALNTALKQQQHKRNVARPGEGWV